MIVYMYTMIYKTCFDLYKAMELEKWFGQGLDGVIMMGTC